MSTISIPILPFLPLISNEPLDAHNIRHAMLAGMVEIFLMIWQKVNDSIGHGIVDTWDASQHAVVQGFVVKRQGGESRRRHENREVALCRLPKRLERKIPYKKSFLSARIQLLQSQHATRRKKDSDEKFAVFLFLMNAVGLLVEVTLHFHFLDIHVMS